MAISALRPQAVFNLPAAVARVAEIACSRGGWLDAESALPDLEMAALAVEGLLTAPFESGFAGVGLASGEGAAHDLPRCLCALGRASLPLGRLYEGHVNAVRLVETYGSVEQRRRMANEAERGALFGVWAADDVPQSLRLRRDRRGWRFEGRKIYCSGASLIRRPVLPARDDGGRVRLVMPELPLDYPVDLSAWTAQGMRASLSGAVDFTGLLVREDELIGDLDSYHREPDFSGGAWRFLAVQLGGMEGLFDGFIDHLQRTGRASDPHQARRLAEAAAAVETARLWVMEAARRLERRQGEATAVVAYVNLARTAVETAALELLELVQRSVGLQAFLRPNPIERIGRDLATYLRQPGPDRARTSAAAWLISSPGSLWPAF
jgi:alkylation response protein AidB-like acyl-CoA dehydrogenase